LQNYTANSVSRAQRGMERALHRIREMGMSLDLSSSQTS
jgi:hypothetical protein